MATGLVTMAIAPLLNGRIEARLDSFRERFLGRIESLRGELTATRSGLTSRIDRILANGMVPNTAHMALHVTTLLTLAVLSIHLR